MELSVREARAQFAAAIDAAARGERVTITRNGKPVAELGPPAVRKLRRVASWEELDRVQERLGIEKPSQPLDDAWRERFDSKDWAADLFGPDYA